MRGFSLILMQVLVLLSTDVVAQEEKMPLNVSTALLKEAVKEINQVPAALAMSSSPSSCVLENGTDNKPVERELKVADCNSEMTATDVLILKKIEDDVATLKDSDLKKDSPEYKKAYAGLLKDAEEGLTPAAKGVLATNLLKKSFAQQKILQNQEVLMRDPRFKTFKKAFISFEAWSEYHIQNFGPGSPIASMGYFDMIKTPVHAVIDLMNGTKTPLTVELYQESMKRVGDTQIALLNAIRDLGISQEEKSEMTKSLREYNGIISQRDHVFLEGTVKRAEALRSTVVQLGGAIEARLLDQVLTKTGFDQNALGQGLRSMLNSSSKSIFKEQTKLVLKALSDGGDPGCVWGILAAEENPKIWKEALISGVQSGARTFTAELTRKNNKKRLGATVDVILKGKDLYDEIKGIADNVTAGAEALKKSKEVEALLAKAKEEKDLIKRGKMEKEAKEIMRTLKDKSVESGVDAVDQIVDHIKK